MSTAVLDSPFGRLTSDDEQSSARTSAKNTKKTRVQLDLPEKSMKRIANLKDMTDAASNAEVIRHAIHLYESMVKEVSDGKEFYVKEPNGSILPYRMFI